MVKRTWKRSARAKRKHDDGPRTSTPCARLFTKARGDRPQRRIYRRQLSDPARLTSESWLSRRHIFHAPLLYTVATRSIVLRLLSPVFASSCCSGCRPRYKRRCSSSSSSRAQARARRVRALRLATGVPFLFTLDKAAPLFSFCTVQFRFFDRHLCHCFALSLSSFRTICRVCLRTPVSRCYFFAESTVTLSA